MVWCARVLICGWHWMATYISMRDLSITHSLQKWTSTKYSISQLECILIFIIHQYHLAAFPMRISVSQFVTRAWQSSSLCEISTNTLCSLKYVENSVYSKKTRCTDSNSMVTDSVKQGNQNTKKSQTNRAKQTKCICFLWGGTNDVL